MSFSIRWVGCLRCSGRLEWKQMAIQLTPDQEQRVQAVIGRGSYDSVDDVMEAALVALEQRTTAALDGTEAELEFLLAEGLRSRELTESEFRDSVDTRKDAMLADRRSGAR